MRKRTASIVTQLDTEHIKRVKTLRKPEPRADTAPQWLRDAAAHFVTALPHLEWTGGFYSWATWLDHLCHTDLWQQPAPNHSQKIDQVGAWRALIDACRASGQVRGTAALYRAKSDLVNCIINSVYRLGEGLRITHKGQVKAPERDAMRRIRAVITRQRRHENSSLTLIRFLDLAFTLSAYKDCRLALATDDANAVADARRAVEAELYFLKLKPSAKDLSTATNRMELFMREHRWLPWYEQVPSVRNEMVIRAREAANAFCKGLPFPHVDVGTGVRGLSRDHLAGAGSMNEWLMTLLDPNLIDRWSNLSSVYETAVHDERGEEDPLLEETSRQVVERVIEHLLDVGEGLDATHSKLVDAAPGIVVTQSMKISGRFTFRQLLELYIHLAMFGEYIHATFYNSKLPSLSQIHWGVVLYEEIRKRILEVRTLIDDSRADRLTEWCLATTSAHGHDQHGTVSCHDSCVSYQKKAINAALASVRMRYFSHPKAPIPEVSVAESDPLTFAAIIAEWDPPLASRIIDAAVRIGTQVREEFKRGTSNGIDLYTHRRVLVCDAACERFGGNVLAAASIMSRLYVVWDVCEQDKLVGAFDHKGATYLREAASRGNFEASAFYGLLLCSEEWGERRRMCNMQRNMESGVFQLCKAVGMGDASAAVDLVQVLKQSSGSKTDAVPGPVIELAIRTLKEISLQANTLSLFLGYLYSIGVDGIPIDRLAASKAYRNVLKAEDVHQCYQAHAANNLAVLGAIHDTDENGITHDRAKTSELFKLASAASHSKGDSSYAALISCGIMEGDLNLAREMYQRCLKRRHASNAVTVIQKDAARSMIFIYDLLIEKTKEGNFCRDLKPQGMDLGQYGRTLTSESLLYITDVHSKTTV